MSDVIFFTERFSFMWNSLPTSAVDFRSLSLFKRTIYNANLFTRYWCAVPFLNWHCMLLYMPRASISQDYWGDIKEDWGSGERKSPRGVQGRSPGRGPGGRSPQNLKLFVKLHIIFGLKYNKQQLLLLLDKINDIISKILGGHYHGRPPLHFHKDRRPWHMHNLNNFFFFW